VKFTHFSRIYHDDEKTKKMKKLAMIACIAFGAQVYAQQKPTEPLRATETSSPTEVEMTTPEQKRTMMIHTEQRQQKKEARRLDRQQIREGEMQEPKQERQLQHSPR
jgi:hypothetical protein